MASRGINKVIIVGNLGQDPEVRYMPNGNAVANISVATSESWRDKQSGEQREQTEWHRIVLYRRLGEVAGEYLRKGSKVYIEGRLQTRKWQGQDGQDRYTTEIIASDLQMLDSRGSAGDFGGDNAAAPAPRQGGGQYSGGGNNRPQSYNQPSGGNRQGDQAPPPPAGGFDDFDDDIPF